MAIMGFMVLASSRSTVFAQDAASTAGTETVANEVTDNAEEASNDVIDNANESVKEPGVPTIYTGGLVGDENNASRYDIKNIRDTLLPSVAAWLAQFLGAIAVLALIWAGVLFLTAGGEAEKIGKASKTAFYTLAALLLMMFGYVLVYLFLTIFTP